MPITRQKVGLGLSAFSEGIAGRGQQFLKGLSDERSQAVLDDAFTVQQQLGVGDVSGARATLLDRLQAIGQLGGDPTDTDSLLLDIERGDTDKALQRVTTVVDFGIAEGRLKAPVVAPAATQAFEELTKGLSDEDKISATRIKLGLDPRAVGSADQTISAEGIAAAIAATQATLARGKETGVLTARRELLPGIESAVTTAVEGAKAVAEQAILDKSNQTTFNVYEIGMRGLVSGLDDTLTGPFVGLLPAVTANQQISDGAVAAMAPVLKQMFRAAGEGIFTDKDQELLLAMIPTRKSLPEARAAQLSNIDAIVRAKLGVGGPATGAAAGDPSSIPGFDQLSPEAQNELRQRMGFQ